MKLLILKCGIEYYSFIQTTLVRSFISKVILDV